MVKISETDFSGLNDLFKENYYALKEVKEIERQTLNIEDQLFLKEIKRLHEQSLITILKLLDSKERII